MRDTTLRTLFTEGPTATCLATESEVIEANAAFARLFSFADALAARGARLDRLLADTAAWRQAVAAAVAGTPSPLVETAGFTSDGQTLLLAWRVVSATDSDRPGTVIAWFTDLTEYTLAPRTPTGARLIRAIGHDLGNMMMVIRGFTEVLPRELSTESRGREWVARIRTASDRAVALAEELLAAGRPPDPAMTELLPATILEGLLPLVRRAVGPGVQVQIVPPAGERTLRSCRDLVEALVLSLVSLARADRPRDTRLVLAAVWTEVDPPALALRVTGDEPSRCWEVRLPPDRLPTPSS